MFDSAITQLGASTWKFFRILDFLTDKFFQNFGGIVFAEDGSEALDVMEDSQSDRAKDFGLS